LININNIVIKISVLDNEFYMTLVRKPLRINFLFPAYYPHPIGGYAVVYEYANYLSSRGHSVRIVYPRRHHESRPPRTVLQPLKDYWRIRETRQRHQPLVPWFELNPDVKLILTPDLQNDNVPDADVTVATSWETAGSVNILSGSKGVKFYLIQHYEVWSGPKEKVDATWRMPLKKIVISKWLQEIGKDLGEQNLRHIPNAIDSKRYRVIIPPENRPLSILSLYHHERFKGVSDSIEVLSRFHEEYADVPVVMFGTLARGKEIPDWISYFENPPQDVLIGEIYNRSAVYLGASLAEGWGLPPAEAMACGCAFVGTDIGGFKDYASHGETALLSSPGNREALLHNLRAIARDSQLLRRIQRAGTSHIQQFTWENSGAALEQYFLESYDFE
jgi:glycosyltransferase involved in cell wall biosynthesis